MKQKIIMNFIKRTSRERGRSLLFFIIPILCVVIGLSGIALAKEPPKEEQQTEIRKMANATLADLYKLQPKSKQVVEQSAGYAVFSNFGSKIFIIGGGAGKGVVIDRKNKKETFMKMVEGQVGIGLGVKKFKQVWVFKTQKALNDFVNTGWEFGGQATAAAKSGDEGAAIAGAIAVDVDIVLYQITDAGLEAMLSAKGTKYYKDDDLN